MVKRIVLYIAIVEAVVILLLLIAVVGLTVRNGVHSGKTAGNMGETSEEGEAFVDEAMTGPIVDDVANETSEVSDEGQNMAMSSLGIESEIAEKLPGFNVTIIGDSITRMSKERLEEVLPGADIHGFSGRTVNYTVSYNVCGLDMAGLLEAEGRLRDKVVFAMGSNNVPALRMETLTSEMFDQLHEYTGDRAVYLMTMYDLYDPSIYDENNRVVREAAEKYEDWYVIDWAAAVEENGPERIIRDEGEAATGNQQAHPTDPEGIDLWATLIAQAVME